MNDTWLECPSICAYRLIDQAIAPIWGRSVTEIPGIPPPSFEMLVFGELQDSKLKLLFYAPPTSYGTPETVGYTTGTVTFSFDQATLSNTYIVGTVKGNFGSGTFTLTRIN